ncbi:polycomb protein Sfmbt isoform X2 [Sitophilus oryzae]|uniref:Polycomb protein Sfmbt isoform X2 n=1 Tax=Sitophilus oryzae TaxID=7048 RepID=A0A6J2XW01_SITOR|nr:polycomb protein Sfmbt isoform X2 [Sitophilus oryzae]
MNVYNTMPGMAEMGMVWMGSQQAVGEVPIGLMPNENNELLLDHQDNVYYTPSHHSMSSQSMDDLHSTMHSSQVDTVESYDMMHYIDMKNESNDSSYLEDDNSQPVYMITTATQTLPCPTRKIKPVKHPGLVLKTPIAYQGNTDPSVIPIQKDGIAVCEKCGAIGVKHAFYTRERRFCSMACARGYSGLIPEPLPQSNPDTPEAKHQFAKYRFSLQYEDDFSDSYIDSRLPQIPKPTMPPVDDTIPLVRRKPSELANSFNWDSQLSDRYFVAAPVTCFKHAPMADVWENIMVGMKVEVENTDCDNVSDAFPDSFWVATVMRIVGYKAQLRYEGFGANDTKDFWVSLVSNQVHPVGWCATRGKPLIPPKTIEDKYSDWKDFLRKRLTGARTLPSSYSNKASESLKSRFDVGLNLEVVDKNHISQVKVAVVHKIVGKRLNVKYYDLPQEDMGFWCHEDSPLLHPVGWAKKVGHHLVAPINYVERLSQGILDDDDATEDLFNPIQVGSADHSNTGFAIGMKLEAIDPLNLSSICVATVMDVLNYGYIMIRIDTYDSDSTGADWFCYHVKSPCIFPVGFCQKHNIPLTPPKGYGQDTFDWSKYLMGTGHIPADPSLFNTYVPLHGFVPGMKIEAADLMDPRLVCIATIDKVVGRLLKVHFDGWEEEFDQWLDCESSDIYPVGWCQSVGHKLEGPPVHNAPTTKSPKVKRKNRKKKNKDNAKIGSTGSTASTTHSTKTIKEPPESYESYEFATQVNEEQEIEDDQSIDHTSIDLKSEISEDTHEPETGQEPAGPDQSLPVASNELSMVTNVSSTLSEPPPERKPTTYVSSSSNASSKLIPRLIDNTSSSNDLVGELCPDEWNVFDVAQFLRVNDCANYCDAFSKQKINGKMLMNLNKEDILEYTGGKVGPSLKIYDLIQQLKIKVNPFQLRHMKANIKKFL